MHSFLCEIRSYSTDDVDHEPAVAKHCYYICRELQGVVQGHAKVLFTLGGGHCVVVNRDREVLERVGLPLEEEQLYLVKVEREVVGGKPS